VYTSSAVTAEGGNPEHVVSLSIAPDPAAAHHLRRLSSAASPPHTTMRSLFTGAAILAMLLLQEASTITVELRQPKAAAIERAKAALLANRFVIDEAAGDGSVLKTAPYRYKNAILFTVRANTVGSDSSARVVLSGTYTIPTLHVKDEQLTQSTRGVKKELWAILSQVADSIRAAR